MLRAERLKRKREAERRRQKNFFEDPEPLGGTERKAQSTLC